MGKDLNALCKDPAFLFKVVEAILCFIGVIILTNHTNYGSYWTVRTDTRDLVVVAVAGYLLITSAFIIVYICDETSELLEKILIFVGGILNLVAGILLLTQSSNYNNKYGSNRWLVLAICATACGILCIIAFPIIADFATGYYSFRAIQVTAVAVAGTFIFTIAFIIAYIADESNRLLEIILVFCGGVLNITAGILGILYYRGGNISYRNQQSLILGITTNVCGVIMIIDSIILLFKSCQ